MPLRFLRLPSITPAGFASFPVYYEPCFTAGHVISIEKFLLRDGAGVLSKAGPRGPATDCNFARVNRRASGGAASRGERVPAAAICHLIPRAISFHRCIVPLPYALCHVYATMKPCHLCYSRRRILRPRSARCGNRSRNADLGLWWREEHGTGVPSETLTRYVEEVFGRRDLTVPRTGKQRSWIAE